MVTTAMAALPGSHFPDTGSTYLQAMRARDLLHPRPEGLYCPPGDFYHRSGAAGASAR